MSRPTTRTEAEKKRYGTHYNPRPYDPTQCAEDVRDQGRWPSYHQCERKPGHGPDGLYCKQHDPAEVERRDQERDKKFREQQERERPKRHGAAMPKIIREIASGHNDPRSLCTKFLSDYDKAD